MWGLILSLVSKLGPLVMGPISQAITGINFTQILSSLWVVVLAAVDNIKKYWRFYLPAFLAVLQLVTAYGWHHDYVALKAEKISHQADIQSYKAAQKKADADARAQEQEIITESKVKANAADKNYSGLLTKYNASLLRYKAAQGRSKSTDQYQGDNQEGSTAQISDGPGASTYVSITMNDAQICANNTARLMAAHDWAIHLGDTNEDAAN